MEKRGYLFDLLNIIGLVGDGTAITKDASFFSTFAVRPYDLAFEPDHRLSDVIEKLNGTFRFLDDGWTIYFDVVRSKKNIPPFPFDKKAPSSVVSFDEERRELLSFYSNEMYITVLYRLPDSKNTNDFIFETKKGNSLISEEKFKFEDLCGKLSSSFSLSFASVKKLNSEELLTFYHSLFSKKQKVRVPTPPFHLDAYLSDVTFRADNVVQMGDDVVLTASLHDFPSSSKGGLFTQLFDAPFDFRYSMRFEYLSRTTAKKSISAIRNTLMQKRKGVGGVIMEALTKTPQRVEDPEAVNLSEEAVGAEGLLSSGSVGFCYISTSLIVRNTDFEIAHNTLKQLIDIVNDQGFIAKQEIFNNPLVFLGSIPGNIYHNKRKHLINTINVAHLFCLSDVWTGESNNQFFEDISNNSSPLMVTKSTANPFFLNLNVGDVGHTLIVGPTGAGKSILLNALSAQYFRYPGSQIVTFDKDKSSQFSCKNAEGNFFDLFADDSDFKLNVFSKIGLKGEAGDSIAEKEKKELFSKNKRFWLSGFFADFFMSKGLPVSSDDKNQILNTLNSMSAHMIHGSFIDFKNSLQNELYRDALEPYISGQYSALFTDGDDSLDTNRFTCFEMNHLMNMGGEIVPFVLLYLFYKVELLFDGKHPVLLILDECWLFFSNPVFSEKLKDWLKVLRKKKVFVVMATQEINDSKSSPIFSTVVNACLTKIFLPNPTADQSINLELYHDMGLSDRHIDYVKNAIMKRDYLYFSPNGCQLFSLDLNKKQIDFLTSFKEA